MGLNMGKICAYRIQEWTTATSDPQPLAHAFACVLPGHFKQEKPMMKTMEQFLKIASMRAVNTISHAIRQHLPKYANKKNHDQKFLRISCSFASMQITTAENTSNFLKRFCQMKFLSATNHSPIRLPYPAASHKTHTDTHKSTQAIIFDTVCEL